MEIKSAEFVISNTDVRKCPEGNKPEYAFIGRSNVGKSSLINMLTNKKGLAMTSQTPGKTLLINHFLINNEWYLVDLPGYGFAQRGKENREQLKRIIENYILDREQLTNLFVLLDCRHEAQKIDLEFMEWLGESGVPFSIIFTKIDKISKRGTPFIPDPTDPDIVDPSNPDENTPNEGTDAYLSVTVTVADWTTWEQGVEL